MSTPTPPEPGTDGEGAWKYAVYAGGMFAAHASIEEAAELYVANRDGHDCEGDLESGFSYWVPGERMRRLIKVSVRPVAEPGVEEA